MPLPAAPSDHLLGDNHSFSGGAPSVSGFLAAGFHPAFLLGAFIYLSKDILWSLTVCQALL